MDITPLKKAYATLERALENKHQIDDDLYEIYRAGTIQHFEYCFELSWKFMKRAIENAWSEINLKSKRDVFREALKNNLITDFNLWDEFLESRNRTTHTYDEYTAEEVYKMVQSFYEEMKYLIEKIENMEET